MNHVNIAGSRAKMASLVLGGLATVAGFGVAGAAAPDVPSVVVQYRGDSLATDAGVNQLYRRIVAASRRVCPDAPVSDLAGQVRMRACRDQAVARAVQQINNAQLAALYASHSKNS